MVFSNMNKFPFLKAFVVLLMPFFLDGHGQHFQINVFENYIDISNPNLQRGGTNNMEDIIEDEEEGNDEEKHDQNIRMNYVHVCDWFQEEIDSEVKWCLAMDRVEFVRKSERQHVAVLSTKRFGKAIVFDGHLKNSELDDYVYHENLVHPALLLHNDPKTVFIMGGGGGSAAREVLKHKSIEKVIMCDIDKEVVDWCHEHMTTNHEAFNDERLQIVYNDAKDELEKSKEKFDVIVGDLSDPYQPGPSNKLYTKSFYERVVKPKLEENGIFVTQAGPAGILTHKAVFSPIFNTMKQVFTHMAAYTAHVPSYGDLCGWIMASKKQISLNSQELNEKIAKRINGELSYLDGAVIASSAVLNKTLQNTLMEETRIFTEEDVNAGNVRGRGIRMQNSEV